MQATWKFHVSVRPMDILSTPPTTTKHELSITIRHSRCIPSERNGAGYVPVAGACENGYEICSFIEREQFLGSLTVY